jgi:hypothetical protein
VTITNVIQPGASKKAGASLELRPSLRQFVQGYRASATAAPSGIAGLWVASVSLNLLGHPGTIPTVCFSLGLVGLVALASFVVLMRRGRLQIVDGRLTRRGLIRTRTWNIDQIARVGRGWQFSITSWAPLRFTFLLDHSGRCLTQLETSAWWPPDSADRIAREIGQAVYVAPPLIKSVPGALPWWLCHPWWFSTLAVLAIMAIACIGIALAPNLGF